MGERLKPAVLKTAVRGTVPGVRIPLPPFKVRELRDQPGKPNNARSSDCAGIVLVFGTCNNDAGAAIDIGPNERSNLALSPRSDIGESREVPQVFWQRGNHGIKLRTFKEPLADIFFREPTNVWGRDDFTALDTKFDGLSEQLCLPVDGSRRPPVFLQTAINVDVNAPGCHVESPQVAECLVDRLQMCFELSQRPTAATCVFLFKRLEQFIDVHLLSAWRERLQSLASFMRLSSFF
jgi:hypothetical protein